MSATITGVPNYKVGSLGSGKWVVSDSSLPFSREDLVDIAIATEVKTLYLQRGKTAFTPLREYRKRRRGKKV